MSVPPPDRPEADENLPQRRGGEEDSQSKASEFILSSSALSISAPLSLCGDIGGTKSLLGLAQGAELRVDRRYVNADFPDFASLLAAFFADTQTNPSRIAGGCLALAGPIADDGRTANLTNLPWRIDSEALARRFGCAAPRLTNDFAAAAMGAVSGPLAHRVTLQQGTPLATAPCLVVGAGTGLGMAIVVPHDGEWQIVAGEGGHLAFAPADEEQMALWAFLRARHGRVTWERVVSGPGLTAIHQFVAGVELTPEDIASGALANPGGVERRSLNLFLAAYGAFAGDMALACLARGGVFLAGGIAAKLLPALRESRFLATFNDKAGHSEIAARMPLHLAVDPLLGLRGALVMAFK